MDIRQVLQQMEIPVSADTVISPFINAEDGSAYGVWKVQSQEKTYVLKKAKGFEISIYTSFFNRELSGAPRFLGSTTFDGEDYFLMDYVPGEDLRRCNRKKLVSALDALIHLQELYWERRELPGVGIAFADSFASRKNRKNYLKDEDLERAYDFFLEQYVSLPRTLCHDDLLPFNILVAEEKATIIDWEVGGMLPYPTSLARLIAHTEDREDAFFYMTEEDKSFAIDYYYENLVKNKGISYADYRKALDAFLLYEYCEWIMLGNKYPDGNQARYSDYLKKAKKHIKNSLQRQKAGV